MFIRISRLISRSICSLFNTFFHSAIQKSIAWTSSVNNVLAIHRKCQFNFSIWSGSDDDVTYSGDFEKKMLDGNFR